jgi:hypothetical protein
MREREVQMREPEPPVKLATDERTRPGPMPLSAENRPEAAAGTEEERGAEDHKDAAVFPASSGVTQVRLTQSPAQQAAETIPSEEPVPAAGQGRDEPLGRGSVERLPEPEQEGMSDYSMSDEMLAQIKVGMITSTLKDLVLVEWIHDFDTGQLKGKKMVVFRKDEFGQRNVIGTLKVIRSHSLRTVAKPLSQEVAIGTGDEVAVRINGD